MSISRTFGRSTSWIVDRPQWAYLLLVVMSAVAGLGYIAPERVRSLFVRPEVEEAAPAPAAGAPAPRPRKAAPNVDAIDLTRSDAILVIESDDIFTPGGATALRHMVATLEALPYIRNVVWMDRVPVLNIFGLREPLFPKSQASPARFAAARDKALHHPLVKGQLLSPDGRTLIVLVNFDWLGITSDDDCSVNLKKAAEAALHESPGPRFTVGVTGHIPLRLTMIATHERNSTKFKVIGYAVVLLMAAILFRGISSVLIVTMGAALGIFWTQGFLNFFDMQDNPFNDQVLPILLSLIGLADGVHMMVQIRRFRADGMSERDAAQAGLQEVGLACFLTAITTSIGFWSLTLAQHHVVRDFGWSCVLGAMLMVISILTVIPLACFSKEMQWVIERVKRWALKPLLRLFFLRRLLEVDAKDVLKESFVEQHLHRVMYVIDWVLERPKFVSWAGIAVTILFTVLALQLRPDELHTALLPESAEPTKALRQMDRALGGLEFSEVRVNWSSKVPSDSGEVLTVIAQVDDLLTSEPLIGTPISIRNFVDALPGDSPTAERASMLELLPPPLKRVFYKPEEQFASVTFRVRDIGIAKYNDVFLRMEAGLKQIMTQHPEFTLDLEGSAAFRWRDLYRVVVDLGSSLGSETIIIIIVLGLVFRSVRMGAIAMVPNIFPLVACASWMFFTDQPLEIVSVVCFTICLGVAVDDTVHFLTRFQEELPHCQSRKEAIRKTFQSVGTSMLMTTIVLIVGLSTVTLSDMREQRIFGHMGVLTMITAMVGDLLILPALLAVYAKPAPGEVVSKSASP